MTIEFIALNQLIASADNVRKTGADEGVAELAASIEAHGLLQPLVVKKARKGRYEVIAGQRRHKACLMLAERGVYADNHPIPCSVQAREADSTELSLAENVMRVAMHPADQFESFRAMIDRGGTAESVAVRFGVTPRLVEQRMKLGRVAPELLQAYRDEDMNLDMLQAFAVSDDHAAQLRVWEMGFRQSWQIRKNLTEGELAVSDDLVRFVGLEAYEAAGGIVRRDLFDDRNSGYVMSVDLLRRLVQARLAEAVIAVQDEGWSWVEYRESFGYHDRQAFDQLEGEALPLPADRQAVYDALAAERATLEDDDNDEYDDETWDRLREIENEIAGIERDRVFSFTPEIRAVSGVILYIGHDGALEIERGLTAATDAAEAETKEAAPADPLALPAALTEYLTAEKTAAIRAELASSPQIGLAAVTHSLALDVFYRGGKSCLDIFTRRNSLQLSMKGFDSSLGINALRDITDRWRGFLPGDHADLWAWCLEQSQDTLIELLTVCAAHTVDAVIRKAEKERPDGLNHADQLAAALCIDMTNWFAPTATNFFGRVSKRITFAAIAEAKGTAPAPVWEKLKKPELAALAEQQIAGTGWLPKAVRVSVPAAESFAEAE